MTDEVLIVDGKKFNFLIPGDEFIGKINWEFISQSSPRFGKPGDGVLALQPLAVLAEKGNTGRIAAWKAPCVGCDGDCTGKPKKCCPDCSCEKGLWSTATTGAVTLHNMDVGNESSAPLREALADAGFDALEKLGFATDEDGDFQHGIDFRGLLFHREAHCEKCEGKGGWVDGDDASTMHGLAYTCQYCLGRTGQATLYVVGVALVGELPEGAEWLNSPGDGTGMGFGGLSHACDVKLEPLSRLLWHRLGDVL